MLKSIFGRAKSRIAKLIFPGSASYWDRRYAAGGNSGSGSYGQLAEFKASYLNRFVREHGVETVVELGCGDGNQLTLAHYPSYFGIDVSETALAHCRASFAADPGKEFGGTAPSGRSFDLSLSLDVIYHLVEDDVYEAYMESLFGLSRRFVIIYASDLDQPEFDRIFPGFTAPHVRHRRFSTWIEANAPGWRRIEHVPNRFPFDPADLKRTSFADFHAYAHDRA